MPEASSLPEPATIMRSRQFLGLLVLAGVVGIVASFAAWCFLELVHEVQDGVYKDLPQTLGYETTRLVATPCALPRRPLGCACGLAAARSRRPHPRPGLNPSPTQPVELPGVVLAAVAGIGLGTVLGPEAPLIALGGGLGFFAIGRLRADAPPSWRPLSQPAERSPRSRFCSALP